MDNLSEAWGFLKYLVRSLIIKRGTRKDFVKTNCIYLHKYFINMAMMDNEIYISIKICIRQIIPLFMCTVKGLSVKTDSRQRISHDRLSTFLY